MLAVSLDEAFPFLENSLLTIQIGSKKPFFPSAEYQIVPPQGKDGVKGRIIANIGDKAIGFKTRVDAIGNARFYSENDPGCSIVRENECLVLNVKNREYVFFSPDGGYSWKLKSIRNANFPQRKIVCEYNREGLVSAIILPDGAKHSIEYRNNLPVKVVTADGAVTTIKWDERSYIKHVETALPPNHPFFPKGKNKRNGRKASPCVIRSQSMSNATTPVVC